jgi:hypothetical protein
MSFLIYPREGDRMSGSGKAGNGRGNNKKRPFRRRGNDTAKQEGGAHEKRSADASSGRPGLSVEARHNASRNRGPLIDRPKWIPPRLNTDPLPVPDCPWCGKPIRDISQALADRDSGLPVHFDCVAARIAEGETLEKGDAVIYVGGGRFGIVSYCGSNSRDIPDWKAMPQAPAEAANRRNEGPSAGNCDFRIKKIIEWENNDRRAEWRSVVCDHYSVT